MTDDAPEFPRETGARQSLNIAGLFVAWARGQPDYLGCYDPHLSPTGTLLLTLLKRD